MNFSALASMFGAFAMIQRCTAFLSTQHPLVAGQQRMTNRATQTVEHMVFEDFVEIVQPPPTVEPILPKQEIFNVKNVNMLSKPLAALGCTVVDTVLSLPNMGTEESLFNVGDVSELLSSPHILSSLSHVALDIVSAAAPSEMLARLAGLAGPCLSIATDYLPDQFIAPEDMACQSVGLFLTFSAFLKSTSPQIISHLCSVSTDLDEEAFKKVFEPTGMSWNQFKSLSTFAMEWVIMEEGETITTDSNDLFWRYEGRMTSGSSAGSFLGAVDFLRKMDSADDVVPLNEQWTAGQGGATVLRINRRDTMSLIESDSSLETPLRSLLMRGVGEYLTQTLCK